LDSFNRLVLDYILAITVEDHIDIQRLMYSYARCADNKDYDGFADVFCEDAIFEYAGTLISPLTEIQVLMHNLEKYVTTQHQVHNVLYDVDGDSAHGETYCLASHLLDSPPHDQKIDMWIIYKDELRRTAQGWRIARRDFNLLWSQTSTVEVQ
jgi:ketosteroid isomerase-like protein